jgi:hypothetical protein
MSPDPYRNSGGPGDPGSWNRYGYVGGDPINKVDPGGMCAQDTNTSVNVCASVGSDGTGGNGGADNQGMQIVNDALQSVDTQGGSGAPSDFGSVTGKYNLGKVKVTKASDALADLMDEVANLSTHCKTVLPKNLSSVAQNINFIDGRVDPYYVQAVGYSYAVTLWNNPVLGQASGISSNVVLGGNFFSSDPARQGITVLHELLHFRLQLTDQGIVDRYHINVSLGQSNSAAFSDWLSNDCKNN